MADAYLWAAREKFDPLADMAFMNHGGVRVNRLGKGLVTRTHVYEMMPFDNQLIIVLVPGAVLRQFVDQLAAEGGGGGVAGISYRLNGKRAIDILVNHVPLDDKKTYRMVNSDYVVDGGGGFKGFQNLEQHREGYLLRDAIIDYCRMHEKSGKRLMVGPEKRITR
jgi:2',3'-cyclic-nucleotide 2'-phosphodiesterase (5'-nucleotidase family)